MFAVLKTGGKQYKVASGDVLRVEKLAAAAGDTVQFNEVLMVGDTVGTPLVDGAGVQAEVIDQIKGEKVIHFVKRRRKHSSKRTKGHRQQLTLLRVTDILESGADASGVMAAVGAGSVSASALAAATAPKAEKPAKAKKAKAAAPAEDAQRADEAPAAEAAPAAETPEVEATRPENLLTEARDGGPDDLKKISGVGPKLEGLLHENGVYHYDQIAAWSASDIAYMDDKLSFKGRIERDNWIEQAKTLDAEKE
ncbi:MAG: 50S ribosomal protein L21 [Pseudomonadota bacterium]